MPNAEADASPVTYECRDGIGLIRIDNPPVNALGHAVRSGIVAALEAAEADSGAAAIVLAGAGRTFPAGADIREFGKPPQPPSLPEVIDALESAAKLTVAAIHGNALGGGLEVALGCDYRIAAAGAKVGLPEVKLGLLPGAGGTQRLPRLIGVEPALQIVVSGDPVDAAEAQRLGILDAVTGEELIAAAIAFGKACQAEGKGKRRLSERSLAEVPAEVFDRFAAETKKRKRGQEAPLRCIEAVRAAQDLPFPEGAARERELFAQLRQSPQSKALRHIFFAERAVASVPGLPKETPQREIAQAAVIGAGTMGGGIAMCFANAGIPVKLLEAQQEALDKGLATIRKNYEASAKRGRLTAEEVEARMGLIQPTLSYDSLGDADMAVEAVFEEMALKERIFGELDRVCKPGAILASNTSTLDIDRIARATGRPQDVVGMHFFSPANVMRLLEVVRGAATAPEVLATAMATGKRIGKVAVAVGNCHAFVGNRILHKRQQEAIALVEQGAAPQQVDKVLSDFGFPMGPFAMADLAGIDVGWRIRKEQRKAGDPNAPAPHWLDALAERGRFGQKTGAGIYRYEAGSRTPIPDPEVEGIVAEAAAEKGIVRRDVGDEEILKSCLYVMVNEAARILEEGIAARALDVDAIWVYGYGFPAYRGGLLFWAEEEVGLKPIADYCQERFAESGRAVWQPAPLLVRLAESGGGFSDDKR